MFPGLFRNMFRCACLSCGFAILTVAAPGVAQVVEAQPAESAEPQANPAEKQKDLLARRQAAFNLLDQALAGARNLTLPQNRIAIACEAFPMVWDRNQSQARTLVSQMIGDFAQAANRQDSREEKSSNRNAPQLLRQQWQMTMQVISQADAELALSFMNASRSFVQTGNPEQEEAEERSLRLQLATQEASRNPRNALRIAEKDLQTPGDIPQELINLLSQVAAKDVEAGAQLSHDIVARVRGADLSSGDSNFNFALNLLNTQFSTPTNNPNPDETWKTLADSIVSAAMSPQFPSATLPILQASLPTLEQLVPARASSLRQKLTEYLATLTPEEAGEDAIPRAQASGDPNQILAVADQAPADIRPNLYQQAAWLFANHGDLQRAQQAAENLPSSFQRDQLVQQAVRQSAWNASSQGQFAAARQLAEQLTPEEDRATMLAQLAMHASVAKQEALAEAILDEAGGLLANRPPGSSVFVAQLQLAQVFAHLKPARALPLLERSASELDQVLAAAVEIDGFMPYQHSFEGGELILNNSFLFNSLVQPYVQATAELANSDLPTARILADRLPLPETRLVAELAVARTVLADRASEPPISMQQDGLTVLVTR